MDIYCLVNILKTADPSYMKSGLVESTPLNSICTWKQLHLAWLIVCLAMCSVSWMTDEFDSCLIQIEISSFSQ